MHLNLIDVELDDYSLDILTYLAGYIEAKQIERYVKCKICVNIINNSQKLDEKVYQPKKMGKFNNSL